LRRGTGSNEIDNLQVRRNGGVVHSRPFPQHTALKDHLLTRVARSDARGSVTLREGARADDAAHHPPRARVRARADGSAWRAPTIPRRAESQAAYLPRPRARWLERLINERAASTANRKAPELPVWRLGVIGSLRRRDIYNDVP
jgi:hypothetical protein